MAIINTKVVDTTNNYIVQSKGIGGEEDQIMVDAEKLDLQRDQLEANTTIDLMRVAADVNKEDSTEAMALLKENMANTREAMKQNANGNGRRKKTTDQT